MFVPSDRAFVDTSGDQPSDPANTFTTTLNLTQCYSSLGLSVPTGMGIKIFAAPIDSDPTSRPNSFAVSEAQFVLQP
jgi:hypothetical protein